MTRRIEPRVDIVHRVRYHRNGIGGAGFFTVEFDYTDDEGGRRRMLATVFEQARVIAVIDLDAPHETWRGDAFEDEVRAAILPWETDGRAFMDDYQLANR